MSSFPRGALALELHPRVKAFEAILTKTKAKDSKLGLYLAQAHFDLDVGVKREKSNKANLEEANRKIKATEDRGIKPRRG